MPGEFLLLEHFYFSVHIFTYILCFFREKEFYTIDPENVLVKIEHSISASSKFAASHRMMHGVLVGINGEVIKRYILIFHKQVYYISSISLYIYIYLKIKTQNFFR